MVTKKKQKPAKKVKSLPAKNVNPKQARGVKGGEVSHSEFSIVKYMDKSTPKLY